MFWSVNMFIVNNFYKYINNIIEYIKKQHEQKWFHYNIVKKGFIVQIKSNK